MFASNSTTKLFSSNLIPVIQIFYLILDKLSQKTPHGNEEFLNITIFIFVFIIIVIYIIINVFINTIINYNEKLFVLFGFLWLSSALLLFLLITSLSLLSFIFPANPLFLR